MKAGDTAVPEAECNDIYRRIGAEIDDCLPARVLAFSSGSLPYGAALRNKSDADINVVFPASMCLTAELVDGINRFVDRLEAIHLSHHLCMDRIYPGEYFTLAQARDASRGRGVPIADSTPRLPLRPGNEYWNQSEETWYLAWLGALAFSRLVVGEAHIYSELRSTAWHTILLLCLQDMRQSVVTTESLLTRILANHHPSGGFGVHEGYASFRSSEATIINKTMASLIALGYLRPHRDGAIVNDRKLTEWTSELASQHFAGFKAPSLLTVASSQMFAR